MTENETREALAEFEARFAEFRKTPGRGKVYKAPKVSEAFRRLTEADPDVALDTLTGDEAVAGFFRGSLPKVIKNFHGTEKRMVAFNRIKANPNCLDDPGLFIRIAAAFPKRSKLQRAALEEVVTAAKKSSNALARARFCTEYLERVNELSREHAESLARVTAEILGELVIRDRETSGVLRDLSSKLEKTDLLPEFRHELSSRLKAFEEFREVGKNTAKMNRAITKTENDLAKAPNTDEEFKRLLEDLKEGSVILQNEEDGECDAHPAFDGRRICVGDGDDMVEFWGGLGVVLDALRELLSSVDLEETDIDWDRCPFEIFPTFEDFAWDLSSWNANFENYLDEHNLADVDHESWGGDSPGRSGVWLRVWIDEDRLVPILKDLWSAYRHAVDSILPVLREHASNAVN